MNIRDRILNFQRFALTCNTSIYNEDAMTAQQLNINNANKIRECMEMISTLSEAIENMKNQLSIIYEGDTEELAVTLDEKLNAIKEQVNNTYMSVMNEDAMTSLELAGCTAKQVNECVKTVNMLSDLVMDVNNNILASYDPDSEMVVMGGEDNE